LPSTRSRPAAETKNFSYWIAEKGTKIRNVGAVISAPNTTGAYYSVGVVNPELNPGITSIKDFAGKKTCSATSNVTASFSRPTGTAILVLARAAEGGFLPLQRFSLTGARDLCYPADAVDLSYGSYQENADSLQLHRVVQPGRRRGHDGARRSGGRRLRDRRDTVPGELTPRVGRLGEIWAGRR
jgi:hypothetical protein